MTFVPDHIDLRPLLADPQAAEILLLARGQLNRAFRTHGLVPPDPLTLDDAIGTGSTELDDPTAQGIEHAMAHFEEAFLTWAERMPRDLAAPVLGILWETHQALCEQQDHPNGTGAAVRKAYEFLSDASGRAGKLIP